MTFIDKWQPKDIIGLIVLVTSLVFISKGINHIFSGISIMIVTYYFRKRVEDRSSTENEKGTKNDQYSS